MLALLALALALQALVAMFQPWPLQAIFDYVILAEPMPEGVQQLIGRFWNVTPESLLAVMIVTLILVALLNGYGLYLQNITLTKVCQAVVQKLRVRLFSHVLKLPITHFYRTEPGETIEHITTDTDDTQKLVEGYSVLAFRSIPTFIGIALIMIVVDWRLALVTLIIAPALVGATYFFGLRIKQTTRVKRRT
jgi:ABC-type multidrug transport system fused ATPase/permease subunit